LDLAIAASTLIHGVIAIDCVSNNVDGVYVNLIISNLYIPQCSKLSSELPSRLFLPGSASYASLNTHRWSNTFILSPSCIVTPASALEVSSIVQILAINDCIFSIKLGGHNPNPKFNNIGNGITVDLKLLNQASVAEDKHM